MKKNETYTYYKSTLTSVLLLLVMFVFTNKHSFSKCANEESCESTEKVYVSKTDADTTVDDFQLKPQPHFTFTPFNITFFKYLKKDITPCSQTSFQNNYFNSKIPIRPPPIAI